MFRVSFFESSARHSDIMHCTILFNDIRLVNQRADTTISIQGACIFSSAIAFLLFLFFALVQCFVVVFHNVSCNVVGSGVTKFNCVDIEDFAKI